MREDMERILLTEADIQARVEELGRQISRDFAGREPIFVGVLKGCFIFMADLLRSVELHCTMDFLAGRKPASISIVTLLDKPSRRRADIKADYSGFEVEDAFVVGYGLDYAEKYRNLPYIGILKPEIYA